MKGFVNLVVALCCLGFVATVAYLVIDYNTANRVAEMERTLNTLTLENQELRKRIAEKNNEEWLYKSAYEDSRALRGIANWHTYSSAIYLLVALIAACGVPILWMGWSYIYHRYYLPNVNRLQGERR